MTTNTAAVVALARTLGEALVRFANDYPNHEPEDPPLPNHGMEMPIGRGQRQQQILELPGIAAEDGMKTSDVASEIAYEVPNTHSTLQALERNGMVELVPGATPQKWRLAPRYRNTAPVFKRLASRLRTGEWTTYGDISIAVRGDTKAARGVGRAAAKIADFPHPERVLMDGGRINQNWVDGEGRGPDYCMRLLVEQGIAFDDEGRANKGQRVAWDELRRRDQSEPVE